MAKISGGGLFGKALKKEGITAIFTLTGGHIQPIFYGCRAEGIEVIDLRHECSAAYAAIAYAEATGKPGVVITTAGPGITNTVTAMEEALMHGVPIVHIGGASPTFEDDSGTLQDMNTLEIMSTCTRWAREINTTERIPEYVGMAFKQAMAAFPGPAYLHIPMDILMGECEENEVKFPEKYRTDALPFGDPELIDKAADMLLAAKRPMIIVGDQARFSSKYGEAVKELADYLKMPVGVINSARGWFGDEAENPIVTMLPAVGIADVIVQLCTNNDFWINKSQPPFFNGDAKYIIANPDPTKIGNNVPAEIGIVGGAGPVAKQLLEAVKAKSEKKEDMSWINEAGEFVMISAQPWIEGFTCEDTPTHPGRSASEAAKYLFDEGGDWNYVFDGGDCMMWMLAATKVRRPGQLFITGPNGTLALGPGAVIGSWAANRKPVILYSGDGTFGFYGMEFDTFARLEIPVVCVISNDSAWGFIKQAEAASAKEEVEKNGHCGCELEYLRRYDKMVGMWDGYGELVQDPKEIIPAIKRAVAFGKPSIINVEVDQVHVSPLVQNFIETLGG